MVTKVATPFDNPYGFSHLMLTHAQIWAAIDALAKRQGLSASSLAKKAGLDPTTFNRSKRQNADGQLRWPSTESIAKVLGSTSTSIDDFLGLLTQTEWPSRRVAYRLLDKTLAHSLDSTGRPLDAGWDEIAFPSPVDGVLYALEIDSGTYAPVYRKGDVIIIAPEAETRRHDRVLIIDQDGTTDLGVLGHASVTHVHYTPLRDDMPVARPSHEIRHVSRIVWASQ